MNKMRLAAAAAAALIVLAGCGGTGEADNNQVAANEAAAPANESAPEANGSAGDTDPAGNAADAAKPAGETAAAGPNLTASSPAAEIRAALIGRWGPDGDCTAATEFRANNSYASVQLGDGRWEQSNEYFTLTAGGETVEFAVQELSATDMLTINPQGRLTRWRRC